MITLIARLGLPKEEAIACMCDGCGRRVYADVHIVRNDEGRLQLWGSTCFSNLVTASPEPAWAAVHGGSGGGRRLSPEEAARLREELASNTATLLEQLEREYAAEQARLRAAAAQARFAALSSPSRQAPGRASHARRDAAAAAADAAAKAERDRRVDRVCAASPRYANFLPGWPKPEVIDRARWAEAERRLPGASWADITKEYWMLKLEEKASDAPAQP